MTMITHKKRLGILVAGGPSPGINSVVGASTIRSLVAGKEVVGILDGFKWIMQGDISHVKNLTIEFVSRIHFRGGSYIGISRENPTRDPRLLENTVTSLLRLNIDNLITIGGDDTAYSAMKLEEMANGRIRVIHVPKTIDNDLDLPAGISTFGFRTAQHYGTEIVKNLMVDARTTSRWFFVVTMGRKAGHLALAISRAAGPTLTLIPEEFVNDKAFSLKKLVDIIAGSIIKRQSYGYSDGVALIAEGLLDALPAEDLENMGRLEKDAHGNIRFDEINLGHVLKFEVQKRLEQFGLSTTTVAKNLGYELRCSDPIAFDMEYTRDLGYLAAEYILNGGNAAMVSTQNGQFVPIPFQEILDPQTGRAKVRMVDIRSMNYQVLQAFMIRLSKEDFDDPHELAKYAATCGITLDEFRKQFHYLVAHELTYPNLKGNGGQAGKKSAKSETKSVTSPDPE